MSMRTTEAGDYLAGSESDRAVNGVAGADSFSLIDRFSNFDGTFRSNRDLRIEGEVKGTIECQGTLFVAQGANVTAKVEAENITVAGDLNGDIRCRGRLQIMPSGRLRGKVTTETLVINEGAFYEGQLEMATPDARLGGSSPRSLPSPLPSVSGRSEKANRSADRGEQPATGNGNGTGNSGASSTFIRRFGGPETPWDEGSERDPGEGGPSEPT